MRRYRSGAVDGPSPLQEVRTGPSQQLHHNQQPGISPASKILSRSRPVFDFRLREPSLYTSAQMRRDISQESQDNFDSTHLDPAFDIPVVESLSPLIISSATPPPVVGAPLRLITPSNRSLTYLQSGPFDQP